MRCVEEVLVWRMKKTSYYPQNIGSEERIIPAHSHSNETYFMSKVKPTEKKIIIGKVRNHFLDYPISLDGFSTRPHDIVKLFIESYTKEGDSVLDLTCYKGLSGMICKQLNRKWTGIDKHFYPTLLIVPPSSVQCLPLPKGLEKKESPIEGFGIFATQTFCKGEKIGEFEGDEMTLTEFKKKYASDKTYCYNMKRANKIIVAKHKRNFITFINDGKHNQEHPKVNVFMKQKFLYALQNIEPGEELLLEYPSYYWK
jgi:hypothetical protein